MANIVQRAAARMFGLPTPDAVASLEADVASLKTRMRMLKQTGSGVPITWGQFDYEHVDSLSNSDRWVIYDKMESDPLIKEGLDSYVLPLCTGKWEIQSASDKPIDKEIADFAAANLLRKASDKYGREYFTQTSWTGQRLIEILDCLKCGFALFSKSTREINGKIVYDRIQWLEPRSVDPRGWHLSETDEIIEVERTYRTPALEYKLLESIPARQLVLYPWDFKGARFEGRPKIRSLYGAWFRKDALLRYSAIWAQKAGAPMPVGHYPTSVKTHEIPLIEAAVKAMRGQAPAEAYAVFPMGPDGQKVELGYAGLTGDGAASVDRMRSVINGENTEIAHGIGTKSRLLGETQSGSRAVGDTQSEDEDVNVEAVKQRICEIENDGIANLPGLIQELVDWNFPNVREYPRLVCARVGPREDLTTLTPLISAITAGVVPKTPGVRKQVTEKFGITLPDADYELDPVVPVQLGPDGQPVKPAPAPAPAVEKPAPRAEDARAARQLTFRLGMERMLRMPDESMEAARSKGFGRAPTVFEAKVCMVGLVADAFQTGGEQIAASLRRSTAQMIEDILGRISGSNGSRSLQGLRRSRPKGQSAMVSAIRERFLEVARSGRQHAREELHRQTEFAKLIASGSIPPGTVMLAAGEDPPEDQVPFDGPNVLPAGSKIPVGVAIGRVIEDLIARGAIETLATELAAEARIASEIAVDEIWARLLDEAIGEYNSAIRSGLSDADALRQVDLALQGLSPAKNDLAARQIAGVAYNQGRDMAAKEAAVEGAANWVIRSELLDARTCASCKRLDGVLMKIGTPEYERLLPPARCEGGDNCRGYPVIVSKKLAEQLNREEAAA